MRHGGAGGAGPTVGSFAGSCSQYAHPEPGLLQAPITNS
jgi:hypothetical protein